jgi:hypothetical protein
MSPLTSARCLLLAAVFGLSLLQASAFVAASSAAPSPSDAEPTPTCSKVTAPPHLCNVDTNATRTFRRFPEPDLVPWPADIIAAAAYTTLTSFTPTVSMDAGSAPLAQVRFKNPAKAAQLSTLKLK